jgi:hypothetical protein
MPNRPDSEIARPPENDPHPVDLSRRKLGIGLGVSAVFTLASRPVLAGQCMTPSSAASGNLSTHGVPPTCTGLTPAQWVAFAQATSPSSPNNPNNGFPGGNVKFHDVFGRGSRADWGSDTRLYEVMADGTTITSTTSTTGTSQRGGFLSSPTSSGTSSTSSAIAGTARPNPISMEFAATLLNIRDGRIPTLVLAETKLIEMWNEWMATAMYAPKAGATWDTDQIVAYLRTLQGV